MRCSSDAMSSAFAAAGSACSVAANGCAADHASSAAVAACKAASSMSSGNSDDDDDAVDDDDTGAWPCECALGNPVAVGNPVAFVACLSCSSTFANAMSANSLARVAAAFSVASSCITKGVCSEESVVVPRPAVISSTSPSASDFHMLQKYDVTALPTVLVLRKASRLLVSMTGTSSTARASLSVSSPTLPTSATRSMSALLSVLCFTWMSLPGAMMSAYGAIGPLMNTVLRTSIGTLYFANSCTSRILDHGDVGGIADGSFAIFHLTISSGLASRTASRYASIATTVSKPPHPAKKSAEIPSM
mmetsp:Transcript_9877/g.27989  ORF Transcript_9877/g.27989 Transcript_9877/m.27989 type:complete len:304 (+) Transcript_9877:994-1905(+)